ncbi:hypothetical protein [Streptomyces sp. NPDC007063]|uniref:hypothetical protein n=1 Tax=Streptomyces sp. NPDC007063 TaxID=3364772 RepID=UPI0036CB2C7F
MTDRTARPLTPRVLARLDAMTPTSPDSGYLTLLTSSTVLAGLDLIAVERAVNGLLDPADLTEAEAVAAGRILLTRGFAPREVSYRTNLARAPLQRHAPDSALNSWHMIRRSAGTAVAA